MPFDRAPSPDRPWALSADRRSILILHPLIPVDPPRRMLDLDARLQLVLPETPRATCGLHHLRIWRAGEPQPPHPCWQWDGDELAPTLHPSIQCLVSGWHGWLRRGRLI